MQSHTIHAKGCDLHAVSSGPADGPAVVFAHALGLDLHVWEDLWPLLPDTLRLIAYDARGHGASAVPDAPYTMGTLIADAEAVCDTLGVKSCVFVGLSMGGMVAQGLAVKRLDLVHGLVLISTAARIGRPEHWADRIAAVTQGGMAAVTDATLTRWFGPRAALSEAALTARATLLTTDPTGYAGCMAAIAGTDFYTPTSGLRLPTLGLAGTEDAATPPDLVRETVELIPGARFALLRRCGHISPLQDPAAVAAHIIPFLARLGHA